MRLHIALSVCLSVALTARAAAPRAWRVTGDASPASRVHLRIALAQDGSAALEQSAIEIATPSHPSYRQHLSADDIAEMLSPSDEAVNTVQAWLQSNGISSTLNKDWLEADVSVSEAQLLLNTSYLAYTHNTLGHTVLRTEDYQIPETVAQYIDFVAPTTQFPSDLAGSSRSAPHRTGLGDSIPNAGGLQAKPAAASGPCGDGTRITLDCIKSIYNINYTPSSKRTSFAVYGTQEAWLNQTDLSTFLQTYNPAAAAADATFDVVLRHGNTTYPENSEANLDTQISLGLAWPIPGILYLNGEEDRFGLTGNATVAQDDYLEFLHELVYNTSVPSVVTTSGSVNEGLIPYAYASRACNMYAAAGARGVTIINSAGDNGAQGGNPAQNHANELEATFPSSCPFVTSVGATVVKSTNPLNETGATIDTTLMFGGAVSQSSSFASSGGFSNFFPRPSWQNEAVSAYMAQIPSAIKQLSGFNASGRGFPDVSAVGFDIATVIDGVVQPEQGTSASAPIWAAIVALLNDDQIARGQPPLGFLNPLLYGLACLNSTALRDITTGGSNYGICIGAGAAKCPPFSTADRGGYEVVKGWDAVTGLGVPDVGAFMVALA